MEVVVGDGMHGDHGLEAVRGPKQVVEVVRTQVVLLRQGGWEQLDSYSVVYGDTHEDCAVSAGEEAAVDALTYIVETQSKSASSCLES